MNCLRQLVNNLKINFIKKTKKAYNVTYVDRNKYCLQLNKTGNLSKIIVKNLFNNKQ